MLPRLAAHIKGISILHQELAAPHHAKTRAYLVAEFPLDMVKIARQVLVALHALTENIGDHFLIRRAKKHLPVMAVLDAQHFLAIGIIAAGLFP